MLSNLEIIGWQKFWGLPKYCSFDSATAFKMTVQRALHDSQTLRFVFVTVLFSNFSEKTAKNCISSSWQGISSNFLALLRCTFHSENIQPSFCTFEGVLVLVFTSQVGNVHVVGNLSFAVISRKKSWEIKKFGKSPWLDSAIVNYYKQKRQRWCYAFLLIAWLVSITYCIFWDLIGLDKLSYIL